MTTSDYSEFDGQGMRTVQVPGGQGMRTVQVPGGFLSTLAKVCIQYKYLEGSYPL